MILAKVQYSNTVSNNFYAYNLPYLYTSLLHCTARAVVIPYITMYNFVEYCKTLYKIRTQQA